MVDLIQKLLERGLAYKADDGVYFNVQKFRDYGKLANIDLESLKTGASGRVSADEYSKENVHDFDCGKYTLLMTAKFSGILSWERAGQAGTLNAAQCQ